MTCTYINAQDIRASWTGNIARAYVCIRCPDLRIATTVLRMAETQAHLRGITISARPRVAREDGDVVHVIDAADLPETWGLPFPVARPTPRPRLHLVKSRIDTASRRR